MIQDDSYAAGMILHVTKMIRKDVDVHHIFKIPTLPISDRVEVWVSFWKFSDHRVRADRLGGLQKHLL